MTGSFSISLRPELAEARADLALQAMARPVSERTRNMHLPIRPALHRLLRVWSTRRAGSGEGDRGRDGGEWGVEGGCGVAAFSQR
jgi:hypothetical protein